MSNADWIPVVSQLKAAIQEMTSDHEGARRTNENFLRECPVVSQITSLGQLATGDAEGALETQKRFLNTINNVTNSIPGVGHIKGAFHHVVGDNEGGNQALNAATRSTVVMATGAAAGLATGAIGAIPAAIAAGASYDLAASGITGKDQGYVAAIKNAYDNPSAGAVFDAAIVPVGDGLAGYSGGRIGSKITTKVKLNSLKAARAAKVDQLNAGFDYGAAGGGGGMSSNQAFTLGKEINTLTTEINTMQQGTPANWVDAKSVKSVTATPHSSPKVMIPGYVNENNERALRRNYVEREKYLVKGIPVGLEDALDYDSYIIEIALTPQQKQNILRRYDQQQPNRHIPQTQFTTVSALSNLRRRIINERRRPNNDPPGTLERMLTDLIGPYWLFLDLPPQFSYTAAALLNSDVQGLYHSFIRHTTDWRDVISFDPALLRRLSPLRREINALGSVSANTAQAARQLSGIARNALQNALSLLPNDVYYDVRTAFVEIQMLMHRFIQRNLTYANYIRRTVNDAGHVRLHLRVNTIGGGTRDMVVCLSDTLHYPCADPSFHNDNRPIRTVITVFFI